MDSGLDDFSTPMTTWVVAINMERSNTQNGKAPGSKLLSYAPYVLKPISRNVSEE
jgi:hypothetical protein